jgi:glutamate racemase
MSDSRPIGIFDAGIGGLTLVKEIHRLMPGENLIFLGDTLRAPYGGRSDDAILAFSLIGAKQLAEMNIKMLIIACHTISSVALEQIAVAVKDIPVIGVVLPGVRAAVLRTAEKKIGVIGTSATIRTHAYSKAIASIDNDIKVYGQACPLFVPIVEEKLYDCDVARISAQLYLYDLIDIGVDCIILGCSHYSLLMETIQGTVGTRIQLLDSALWTAKEAQDLLTALGTLNPQKNGGFSKSRFLFTDLHPDLEMQASIFLDNKMPVVDKVYLGVL